jgi:hypothetical protein
VIVTPTIFWKCEEQLFPVRLHARYSTKKCQNIFFHFVILSCTFARLFVLCNVQLVLSSKFFFVMPKIIFHCLPPAISYILLNPSMAPTNNKKRASSLPPRISDSKRAATGKGGKTTAKTTTSGKPLSTLGFSSSKRQQFSIGTKLCLDDSIYKNTPTPDEVKNHVFVYEITEVSENGKSFIVEYKNQVMLQGGEKFRTYKDSEDPQVSISFWVAHLI